MEGSGQSGFRMEFLSRMGINEAILAPELVSLGAVLGVAVGYYVSAVPATDDEDFPHLVMGKFFLVSLCFAVARFQYRIAILAIIDGFKNCLVPFVYPTLSHGGVGRSFVLETSIVLVFRRSNLDTLLPVMYNPRRKNSVSGRNRSVRCCYSRDL
jgi:hypothetical protein